MANFVILRQGSREEVINKDFIIRVNFYSNDKEQVLAITFAHNVEFPHYPESERECKQMRFYFNKPNDISEISNHSRLSDFVRVLNKQINTIWLEDFFAPRKKLTMASDGVEQAPACIYGVEQAPKEEKLKLREFARGDLTQDNVKESE